MAELSELFCQGRITFETGGYKKRELITRLAQLFADDLGRDVSVYADPLMAREKLGTTAIGKGVAFPHGKVEGLAAPAAAVAILRKPVSFQAPDGIDVDVVIAFVSPAGAPGDLATISSLARRLRKDGVLQEIRSAGTAKNVIEALTRDERER